MTQQTDRPPRFRILSFDGGPTGLSQLHMLRALEQASGRTDLVHRADLIAGTSFGALLALRLALEVERGPTIDWDAVIDEASALFDRYRLGPLATPRMALGRSAVSRRKMRSIRAGVATFLGLSPDERKPLSDLRAGVALVAFDLRTRGHALAVDGITPYGARVFTNLAGRDGAPADATADADVVDVALRSGAMPVLMPVVDGYVDGALFANNPAMSAVAVALERGRGRRPDGEPLQPRELAVLSLGGDDTYFAGAPEDLSLERPLVTWGPAAWGLNPFEPLLLLKLVVNSAGRGVDFQTAAVVGRERVCRLLPPVVLGDSSTAFQDALFGRGQRNRRSAELSAQRWSGEASDARAGLLARAATALQLGRTAAAVGPGLGRAWLRFGFEHGWRVGTQAWAQLPGFDDKDLAGRLRLGLLFVTLGLPAQAAIFALGDERLRADLRAMADSSLLGARGLAYTGARDSGARWGTDLQKLDPHVRRTLQNLAQSILEAIEEQGKDDAPAWLGTEGVEQVEAWAQALLEQAERERAPPRHGGWARDQAVEFVERLWAPGSDGGASAANA